MVILLNKYNTASNKVSTDAKLNIEPVYNEKILKIKTKFYCDEPTDF